MPWEVPITVDGMRYPVRFNTENEPTQDEIDEAVQQITNQAPPASEKPFWRTGDVLSALGDVATNVLPATWAGVRRGWEGIQKEHSPEYMEAMAADEARNRAVLDENARREAAGELSTAGENIREIVPSLGFMGASIPATMAGARTGAFTGGRAATMAGAPEFAPQAALAGGVIGGFAGGFGASYRMMGAQFMDDAMNHFNELSMQKLKRPLNDVERQKIYDDLLPVAQNTALWEAAPEAIGNLATLGAGKVILGIGKPAFQALVKSAKAKVLAGVGSQATELATEGITEFGQGNDQAKLEAYKAGLPMESVAPKYQGAQGLWEATKEVAPAVATLGALTAGAGGLAYGANKALSKAPTELSQAQVEALTARSLASAQADMDEAKSSDEGWMAKNNAIAKAAYKLQNAKKAAEYVAKGQFDEAATMFGGKLTAPNTIVQDQLNASMAGVAANADVAPQTAAVDEQAQNEPIIPTPAGSPVSGDTETEEIPGIGAINRADIAGIPPAEPPVANEPPPPESLVGDAGEVTPTTEESSLVAPEDEAVVTAMVTPQPQTTQTNAIQKQSTGSVLQREQKEARKTGSERERVEPSLEGQEAAGTRQEGEKVAAKAPLGSRHVLFRRAMEEFARQMQKSPKNQKLDWRDIIDRAVSYYGGDKTALRGIRSDISASIDNQAANLWRDEDASAQPITPQGKPTTATEGKVMPGGSAVERVADKVYLSVPFPSKDAAKSLGAKWDKEKKLWFIQRGENGFMPEVSPRWIPDEQSVLRDKKELSAAKLNAEAKYNRTVEVAETSISGKKAFALKFTDGEWLNPNVEKTEQSFQQEQPKGDNVWMLPVEETEEKIWQNVFYRENEKLSDMKKGRRNPLSPYFNIRDSELDKQQREINRLQNNKDSIGIEWGELIRYFDEALADKKPISADQEKLFVAKRLPREEFLARLARAGYEKRGDVFYHKQSSAGGGTVGQTRINLPPAAGGTPQTTASEKIATLKISELKTIPEDWKQAQEDKEANNERWQKAIQSKEPIRVIPYKGGYRVSDGHHRLLNAKSKGETSIEAIIEPPLAEKGLLHGTIGKVTEKITKHAEKLADSLREGDVVETSDGTDTARYKVVIEDNTRALHQIDQNDDVMKLKGRKYLANPVRQGQFGQLEAKPNSKDALQIIARGRVIRAGTEVKPKREVGETDSSGAPKLNPNAPDLEKQLISRARHVALGMTWDAQKGQNGDWTHPSGKNALELSEVNQPSSDQVNAIFNELVVKDYGRPDLEREVSQSKINEQEIREFANAVSPKTFGFNSSIPWEMSAAYTSGSGGKEIIIGTKGGTTPQIKATILHEAGHHLSEEGMPDELIPLSQKNEFLAEEVRAIKWSVDNAERFGLKPKDVIDIIKNPKVLAAFNSIYGNLQTTASEKQTPTPSRKGVGASGVAQAKPAEGSIPADTTKETPYKEQSRGKVEGGIAALDAMLAEVPEAERAKWTPAVRAKAAKFFASGNYSDLDGLFRTQKTKIQEARYRSDPEAAAKEKNERRLQENRLREEEKENARLEQERAKQARLTESRRKSLDSIIGAPQGVEMNAVSASDGKESLALVHNSGDVPGVLTAFVGTSKDFLANPANEKNFPDLFKLLKAGRVDEGNFAYGRAFVFTDGIGINASDRANAEKLGITPAVAAVRRVLIHESLVHRGIFGLPAHLQSRILQWVRQNTTPEQLDALAQDYPQYSNWRTNENQMLALCEEFLAKKVEKLTTFPSSGPLARLMDILKDIWRWITGNTGEPTIKNLKDVVKLLKAGAEIADQRLVNGGKIRMSQLRSQGFVTPEMDKAYMDAVNAGDMATAQRMVDEAAKTAGYTEKAYHGSPNKPFWVFDPLRKGERTGSNSALLGYFASSSQGVASQYRMTERERSSAGYRGPLAHNLEDAEAKLARAEDIEVFAEFDEEAGGYVGKLKTVDKWGVEYTYDADPYDAYQDGNKETVFDDEDEAIEAAQDEKDKTVAKAQAELDAKVAEYEKAAKEKLESSTLHNLYLKFANPLIYDFDGGSFKDKSYSKLVQEAIDGGYDGVIMEKTNDSIDDDTVSDVFVFFKSSQAKLADPVTRDNAGNVIPLSQRFNAATPDIRASYIGEGAIKNFPEERRQFMRDSLDAAKAMAANGKSSEEIRAVTGWFPGKYDGKLRFEISDNQAAYRERIGAYTKVKNWLYGKLSDEAMEGTMVGIPLRQILDFPELYEAYPQIKKIKVDLEERNGAAFLPESNTIALSLDDTPAQRLSYLLHELQHWIQTHEGFAKGASPKGFGFISKQAFDEYQRTAGEIEARDVQARQKFTPEQRKAVAPYSSENIAPEDAIVIFGNQGVQESRPTYANPIDAQLANAAERMRAMREREAAPPVPKALARLFDTNAQPTGTANKLFQTAQAPESGKLGDIEAMSPENIDWSLTQLDGRMRQDALGASYEHYKNADVADQWYRYLANKVLSEDALMELNSMYAEMNPNAQFVERDLPRAAFKTGDISELTPEQASWILINTDGEDRQRLLGVTRKHYSDSATADQWANYLAGKVASDPEAMAELSAMHQEMNPNAGGLTPPALEAGTTPQAIRNEIRAAYDRAMVGESSIQVPIQKVFDEAQNAIPSLTEREFGEQLQNLYEDGSAFLVPTDRSADMIAAGEKWGVYDAAGMPASYVGIMPAQESPIIYATPIDRNAIQAQVEESAKAPVNEDSLKGFLLRAIAMHGQPSSVRMARLDPDAPLQVSAQPNGELVIGLGVRQAGEVIRNSRSTQAGFKYLADAVEEEMIHFADLLAMRSKWEAQGKKIDFDHFIRRQSMDLTMDLMQTAETLSIADKEALRKVLAANLAAYSNNPIWNNDTLENVIQAYAESPMKMNAELVRSLIQAKRSGEITATGYQRIANTIVKWLQDALNWLKQSYNQARGGTFGNVLARRIQEVEGQLDALGAPANIKASRQEREDVSKAIASTKGFTEAIDAIKTASPTMVESQARALKGYLPDDHIQQGVEPRVAVSIALIDRLLKSGIPAIELPSILNSPAFLDSLGISENADMQQYLAIEALNRINLAATDADNITDRNALVRQADGAAKIWNLLGEFGGRSLGTRGWLMKHPRYAAMFVEQGILSNLANQSEDVTRANIVDPNAVVKGAEKAAKTAKDAATNQSEEDLVDSWMEAAEETLSPKAKGLFDRIREKLARIGYLMGLSTETKQSVAANLAARFAQEYKGITKEKIESEIAKLRKEVEADLTSFADELLGKDAPQEAKAKVKKSAAKAAKREKKKKLTAEDKAKKKQERANAVVQRLIYRTEELFRQGFKNESKSINADSILKAFRDQVKQPVSDAAFTARVKKLNVTEEVAARMLKTAARERFDQEQIKKNALLDSDEALKKIMRKLSGKLGIFQVDPTSWRKLFSTSNASQEQRKVEMQEAIKSDPAFGKLDADEQEQLADLLDEAWQAKHEEVLKTEINRLTRTQKMSDKAKDAINEAIPEIIQMVNRGTFDNAELAKIVSTKFGFRDLTAEERGRLREITEKLQQDIPPWEHKKLANELRELLADVTKLNFAELAEAWWVSSVLSGPRTAFTIGLGFNSGGFEVIKNSLGTILLNPGDPNAWDAGFKAIKGWLSSMPREAQRALAYLKTGDVTLLDSTMSNDAALIDRAVKELGSVGIAAKLLKSKNPIARKAGQFMAFMQRLLTALDMFNGYTAKYAGLPLAYYHTQEAYNPKELDTIRNHAIARQQVLNSEFGGVEPTSFEDKARLNAWATDKMWKDIQRLGTLEENANYLAQQANMTLDPTGVGGIFYHTLLGVQASQKKKSADFIQKQKEELLNAEDIEKHIARFNLALGYVYQFAAHNFLGALGLKFARFAGNKLNQTLSFIPLVGLTRLAEKTDAQKMHMINVIGAQSIGFLILGQALWMLSQIADEPDDEKRGWDIQGNWGNLTPERKQQLLASGKREYTVYYKGKRYSYANWPISGMLSAIGSMADLIRYSPDQWNEKSVANRLASGVWAAAASVGDSAALSQLSELLGTSMASRDPIEASMSKFNRVFGNYAGGFIPRILKDADLMQNPKINTYKTLWERMAKEVPIARRYEGKALLDVFGSQVAPSRLPWSRELVLQPPEPEYRKLGQWNNNGIWLASANPQNRMVGKGRNRRPMTEVEADRYINLVGKGYRDMVLRYGDRVLSMPKERAKAFVSDKADEIRDRAAKLATRPQ